jgi:pimeloyl-ACP methyl ester carboxylesterase
MEPRIRYTRTKDGVNIAYYAIGTGPVVVALPPHVTTTMEAQWRIVEMRRGLEYASRAYTVVRLDLRGSGLSDAYDGEFTLDALAADLRRTWKP